MARLRVPHMVHMDVEVDTATKTVTRVVIHGETVFRNTDDNGFPIFDYEDERRTVSPREKAKAVLIADQAEWPAWENG